MKIRHLAIIALIPWCALNLIGIWTVVDWFALLQGFLLFLPFPVLLVYLSGRLLRGTQLENYLGYLGIGVGAMTIIIPVGLILMRVVV